MNAPLPLPTVSSPALSRQLSSRELCERLSARFRIVVPALRQRLGPDWTAAETDLVLAHYLYGLVEDASPAVSAGDQLALLRDVGRAALNPDALHCALHTAPPSAGAADARAAQLARALAAAEGFGRRDAQAALLPTPADPNRPIEPNSTVNPVRHAT